MNRVLPAALLVAMVAANAAFADEPAVAPAAPPDTSQAPLAIAPPVDPAAIAIFDRAVAALKDCKGISLEFESKRAVKDKISTESSTFQWKRPNLLRVEMKGEARRLILADGKSFYLPVAEKTFQQAPQSGPVPPRLLAQTLTGGLGMVLPPLLMGDNPLHTDGSESQSLPNFHLWARALPNERIGSLDCEAVRHTVQYGDGAQHYLKIETTTWLDTAHHLPRRVQMKADVPGHSVEFTDDVTKIDTNPTFAPGTFVWKLPAGSKIAAAVESETYWDPKLVRGAAPYPLTGRDLSGKPISLAKYKGKVVLLDFWATWCGPCVHELPNVLRNHHLYNKKGFEVIGISLDGDRKSLTNFIKSQKMPWPQLFDGKNWEGANVRKYQVKAIPFSLLIGRDGRIAAINPVGPELEPAILKALGTGKSK